MSSTWRPVRCNSQLASNRSRAIAYLLCPAIPRSFSSNISLKSWQGTLSSLQPTRSESLKGWLSFRFTPGKANGSPVEISILMAWPSAPQQGAPKVDDLLEVGDRLASVRGYDSWLLGPQVQPDKLCEF